MNVTVKSQPILAASLPPALTLESLSTHKVKIPNVLIHLYVSGHSLQQGRYVKVTVDSEEIALKLYNFSYQGDGGDIFYL